MIDRDEFDRLDAERWARIDALARERRMDPPSERRELVERVAWGMHASRGLGSPRKEWAEMPEDRRVELLLAAAGAIAAYERYTLDFPLPGDERFVRVRDAVAALDRMFLNDAARALERDLIE